MANYVLAADIGGTNANFALVNISKTKPRIIFDRHYKTQQVKNFYALTNNFIDESMLFLKRKGLKFTLSRACFSIAGPVVNKKDYQTVSMINADITIDTRKIIRNTRLKKVLIINDFISLSYATNLLSKKDYVILSKGMKTFNATKCVVGAGTGLGKSILFYNSLQNNYIPLPSEGGHGDMPLLTDEELKIAAYIKKKAKLKHQISYEDILSGRGIEHLYAYYNETYFNDSCPVLNSYQITSKSIKNPCKTMTIKKFIEIYARCCRNFVLDTLAVGGLYIAGGFAKNTWMFSSSFIKEFTKNNQYKSLLEQIPVYLITNYNISLLGAAYALKANKTV